MVWLSTFLQSAVVGTAKLGCPCGSTPLLPAMADPRPQSHPPSRFDTYRKPSSKSSLLTSKYPATSPISTIYTIIQNTKFTTNRLTQLGKPIGTNRKVNTSRNNATPSLIGSPKKAEVPIKMDFLAVESRGAGRCCWGLFFCWLSGFPGPGCFVSFNFSTPARLGSFFGMFFVGSHQELH